jgi:hypothetical protein
MSYFTYILKSEKPVPITMAVTIELEARLKYHNTILLTTQHFRYFRAWRPILGHGIMA